MLQIPEFVKSGLFGLRTTYALIDFEQNIIDHAPRFSLWIRGTADDISGIPLIDIIPELVGQEAMLDHIQQRAVPSLRLENIHRTTPHNQLRYFMITVVPGEPHTNVAWVVLLTDVTEESEQLQKLTQSQNELRLARQELSELNYQLDYLLWHYVPSEVTGALLTGKISPEPEGQLKEVSILSTQIRGVSTLPQQFSSNVIIEHLNSYLDIASSVISANGGTVCQLQGDSLMAIFNLFDQQPNHPMQAIEAGLSLQQGTLAYQEECSQPVPELYFSVGINSGLSLVGNIGTRQYRTYTAVGQTVNIAKQIASVASIDHVWISQITRDLVGQEVITRPVSNNLILMPCYEVLPAMVEVESGKFIRR